MPETVDIPVPQIVLEQVAEVIQLIPQEPISERTVEQAVDVPLVRCIDRIVDVPVVKRCQSQYSRRAAHMPVAMLPQTTDPAGAGPAAHRGALNISDSSLWTGVREQ